MNLSNPGIQGQHWNAGGPKQCSGNDDDVGCAYDYGWKAAAAALAGARALSVTAGGSSWWVDVETGNTWSANARANRADIQGAIDYLHANTTSTAQTGVYSTPLQWAQIAAGAPMTTADAWVVGTNSGAESAATSCALQNSFTGGPVALVQYPMNGFDGDLHC